MNTENLSLRQVKALIKWLKSQGAQQIQIGDVSVVFEPKYEPVDMDNVLNEKKPTEEDLLFFSS